MNPPNGYFKLRKLIDKLRSADFTTGAPVAEILIRADSLAK
jgi:hypothetical protein